MSALPITTDDDGSGDSAPERNPDELLRDIHRMVSELHQFVTDMAPSVRKVGEDIQSGGLMGLLTGMMTGGRRGSQG